MAVSYPAVETSRQEIRALCLEDLPDVLDIERNCYSFPWTEAVFRDCFRPDYRPWGLFLSGSLVGYAVVAYVVDEAHLLNICVSRQKRRLGLARHLLRRVIREAAVDGMAQVLLEVRVTNRAATELYLTEGFSEIGRRPGYYPSSDGREDAIVFSLSIASPAAD